ncbi:MAG: lipid-A-disaccharide synthase, partial [Pseudomonadota bacterium]
MAALRAREPDIRFAGIGGPLMEAEGLTSLFPMSDLSVMGLA